MIFAFIVSFVFTFATTPLARRFAYKIGAIDVPKDGRRMHKKPTPRIGGLAIVFGFFAAAVCFADYEGSGRQFVGVSAGALILVAMGIVDDCKALDAKLKFVIQIIAAFITIYVGDIKIDVITNPNLLSDNPYFILPEWLSVTVTTLWIVFITNAVNFIDGLDGLACGVSTIAALTLLCIALIVGEPEVAFITSALAGACFGFLPYNFNPAKLFMGDTGALLLGFVLSTISVQGLFKGYAVISIAAPFLILGLPIFDTASAILRRLKSGRPIMSPDRGHLHHRLVDAGFSQKQAVTIIYLLSLVLCITAVALIATGAVSWWAFVIVLFAFTLFLWLAPKIIECLSDKDESKEEKHA